jgi:hypothetical protein
MKVKQEDFASTFEIYLKIKDNFPSTVETDLKLLQEFLINIIRDASDYELTELKIKKV